MTNDRWSIHIDKENIKKAEIIFSDDVEQSLATGEIEVAIRKFALTANNITYATLGKSFGSWTDMPGYWAFFPSGIERQGQLPVWGFADVVRSAHPDIAEGETLYGYFPMASHLIMRPGHVKDASLVDTISHREKLAPVYNQYNRVQGMTDLKTEEIDLWPVFRPLLVTGYMICDQFDEQNFYKSEALLITSASSKTAMMTANCLKGFKDVPKAIGLTSAGNKSFVERSGLYDAVMTYDDIDKLPASSATALIDMAGNGDVIDKIHRHFNDALTFSMLVGLSHWDSARPSKQLPGPRPLPFFAPGRIKQRTGEWGGDGLRDRFAAAWDSFSNIAPTLTTIVISERPEAAKQAYEQLISGKIDPQISTLIKLD